VALLAAAKEWLWSGTLEKFTGTNVCHVAQYRKAGFFIIVVPKWPQRSDV
jgi:hypothetical protein